MVYRNAITLGHLRHTVVCRDEQRTIESSDENVDDVPIDQYPSIRFTSPRPLYDWLHHCVGVASQVIKVHA